MAKVENCIAFGAFVIYIHSKNIIKGLKVLEKIISKIFFKKVVCRIVVVLTFFLSIALCARICTHEINPYSYRPKNLQKYNNFIEFVERELVLEHVYSSPTEYYRSLYESAFVFQAKRKGIWSGTSSSWPFNTGYLIERVLSCDETKLKAFHETYRTINGFDFWTLEPAEKISVDCDKAKTIALESERYYFARHILRPALIISFVWLPLAIFILWLAIRFIIISPILWIFRKDS